MADEGGIQQCVYVEDGLSHQVEMHFACENLADLDTFSKSDPMIVVYLHNKKT